MKMYRVVTRNFGEKYSVVYENIKSRCEKYVCLRWGHWPPWAAVTSRDRDFHRCFESRRVNG